MKEQILDLGQINQLINDARGGYEKYRTAFQIFERQYFLEYSEETKKALKESEKSSLYFPKARGKSTKITDILNKVYFSNTNKLSITGQSDDANSLGAKLEKAVAEELDKSNVKFFTKLQQPFAKVPFYGTVIAKVYWNNGIVIEDIPIDKAFFDKDAPSFELSNYFVHEFTLSKSQIDSFKKSKLFDEDAKFEGLDDNQIYMQHNFTDFYFKSGDKWYVTTLYNGVIVRKETELTSGLPIFNGGIMPQLKRIQEIGYVGSYHDSMLTAITPLQEEYNTKRNLLVDASRQAISPKFIASVASGINQEDLDKPTGMVSAVNPSAIQMLPQANLGMIMTDVNAIEQDISESTGVSPMMMGSDSKTKTATERSIEYSEGSTKVEAYVRYFNESFYEPMMRHIAKLVYQHSTSTQLIGVEKTTNFDELKLTINYNTGLGVQNDEIKSQKTAQAQQMIMGLFNVQSQLVQAGVIQKDELITTYNGLKEITKEAINLVGVKNADEYLGSSLEKDMANAES